MWIKHVLAGLAKPPGSTEDFSAYNSPIGGVAPTLILDFDNEVFAADTGSGLVSVARDTLISNFSAYETLGGVQRMRLDSTDGDTTVSTSAFNFSYTGGTVQVLGQYDEAAFGDRLWQFDDNTDNADRIAAYFSSSIQLRGFVQDSGTTKADITSSEYTTNTLNGFAFSWANADFAVSIDGEPAVTSAGTNGGVLPTDSLTTLHVGNSREGNDHPGGGIQKLVYWNTQLSDVDVESLSGEGILSGLTHVPLTRSGLLSNGDSFTVSFGGNGASAGDRIYYIANKGGGNNNATLNSLTESVGGTIALSIGSTNVPRQASIHFMRHTLTPAQIAAGSFNLTVDCKGRVVVHPILVKGSVSSETLCATPVSDSGSSSGTSPFNISVPTVSGGVLLAGAVIEDDTDDNPNGVWSGVTELAPYTQDTVTGFGFYFATASSLATETRTVTFAHDEQGTDRAAHSLAIS